MTKDKNECEVCKGKKGWLEDTGASNPDGSWISMWVACPYCTNEPEIERWKLPIFGHTKDSFNDQQTRTKSE